MEQSRGEAEARLRQIRNGWAISSQWLPVAGLVIAVAASMIWLLTLDAKLTFIADDWLLLVKRHEVSLDYFLHPFHGNIVAGPAVIYKALQSTVGMGSATPYYAVSLATFALGAVLLFVYIRRRVGGWLALCAAVLILFLGAAFEDLLFAFQIGYYGGVAFGIAMLIALDREDDLGDRLACAFLALSLLFSSLGIAFAAGAVADVIFGRRPRGQRLYVALLPITLFILWWIGWGHVAQTYVDGHNIVTTPKFVFEAASAGIVSLLGLATGDGSEPDQPHLIWGKLLLVAGVVLLILKAVREGRVSRGLAVGVVIGLTFWTLAGVNRDESRLPTSSRFQYPSAVFILLILAEGLRGLRRPPALVIAAALGTALAVSGGISLLEREHSERWRPHADYLRAHLGAIEVAGPAANPQFNVFFPPDINAPARAYLDAVEAHGSPALSEEELATSPAVDRLGVDLTIAEALGLAIVPAGDAPPIRCQELRATQSGLTGLTLTPGTYSFENLDRTPVELLLARFSEELSVSFGEVAPRTSAALTIPPDGSQRPWVLGLKGSQSPVELCVRTADSEPAGKRRSAT